MTVKSKHMYIDGPPTHLDKTRSLGSPQDVCLNNKNGRVDKVLFV